MKSKKAGNFFPFTDHDFVTNYLKGHYHVHEN
uniref:Uncharacterized protein n=1 Tax=Anguilla anguilla TaxID=7936 RepID=A0A0E9XEV3_ANGAN